MKNRRSFTIWSSLVLLSFLLVVGHIAAQQQKKGNNKYVCSEANPASMCNASTQCGSGSTPCTVDVKRRGGSSATATPSIPGAKSNTPFCVKVGTTVTFQSTSKNTGFVIDFGPNSPFDTGGSAIMGGADRPISVVAKRAGCFKYSAGACTSGTIYGMCGQVETELVVTQ
jgi:hypothetical protein